MVYEVVLKCCVSINCIMKILHKTLALLMVFHYQFQLISFLSFLYQKKKNHERYGRLPKLPLAQGLLHLAITQIHEFHIRW